MGKKILANRLTIIYFLTFLALLVRVVPLYHLIQSNASQVWDAYGYYYRATAIKEIISDVLHGNLPAKDDLYTAYRSHWPPFQSMLLSIGLIIGGDRIYVDQIIIVLIAVLNTPLVYLLTAKLANERASLIASAIYAIYPSFVHISLHLLSEIPHIFLTLTIILLVINLIDLTNLRKSMLLAGCPRTE